MMNSDDKIATKELESWYSLRKGGENSIMQEIL